MTPAAAGVERGCSCGPDAAPATPLRRSGTWKPKALLNGRSIIVRECRTALAGGQGHRLGVLRAGSSGAAVANEQDPAGHGHDRGGEDQQARGPAGTRSVGPSPEGYPDGALSSTPAVDRGRSPAMRWGRVRGARVRRLTPDHERERQPDQSRRPGTWRTSRAAADASAARAAPARPIDSKSRTPLAIWRALRDLGDRELAPQVQVRPLGLADLPAQAPVPSVQTADLGEELALARGGDDRDRPGQWFAEPRDRAGVVADGEPVRAAGELGDDERPAQLEVVPRSRSIETVPARTASAGIGRPSITAVRGGTTNT